MLPLGSHPTTALVVNRIAQEARDKVVAPGLPQGPRIKPGEMSPPGPSWHLFLVRAWLLTVPSCSREGIARGGNRTLVCLFVWGHTLTYCQLWYRLKKPSREAVGKLAFGIVFFYKF
jgi:hypothetical protein